MDKPGALLLLLLSLLFFLSPFYIPSNTLQVHHASARIEKIFLASPSDFSLGRLHTSSRPSPLSPSSPYLFIHGHKGSITQGISMTQYFHTHGLELDMYSLDFNEGAVGISPSLLLAEVNFTQQCILEISRRYPNTPIGIVAHSFGGVVAALALQSLKPGLVKGLLTLSTPFTAPPVTSDWKFVREYHKMHSFLKSTEMPIISITGGIRDLVVPPQLTSTEVLGAKHSYHCYSSQISGLHADIDHIALLWGQEFFHYLSELLKLMNKHAGGRLIKEAKKLLQSDISRITEYRDLGDRVYVAASNNRVGFNAGGRGALINGTYYYVVSAEDLEENRKELGSEVRVKELVRHSQREIGWLTLLAGHKIEIKSGLGDAQVLGTHIQLSKSLSEPRFPARVTITGGEVQAVIAKCGKEEIIRLGQEEIIMYFHEYCENGPEVWIFGFEPQRDYVVEIQIDPLGTVICLVRDYRLHMFTCMCFLSLCYLTHISIYLEIAVALIVYTLGSKLRAYSFASWESTFDLTADYSVFSMIYIFLSGRGLAAGFSFVFEIIAFINRKVSMNKYLSIGILPLAYFFPWEVAWVLVLTSLKDRKHMYIAFITLFALTPEQIGYYISLYSHGIKETDYQVLPVIILVLSQINLEAVGVKWEIIIAAFLMGTCVHDLHYRGVVIFQALCIWLSFKSFIIYSYRLLKRQSSKEGKNNR